MFCCFCFVGSKKEEEDRREFDASVQGSDRYAIGIGIENDALSPAIHSPAV